MNSLEIADSNRLAAAQGWLDLDNPAEAGDELARISPENRAHPDVLQVTWRLHAKTKKWAACLDIATTLTTQSPERSLGWLQRAFALHMLQRTTEARDLLLSVVDQFKTNPSISYYLAFYSCKLGQLPEARQWLHAAFKIAADSGRRYLKVPTLEESDLRSSGSSAR